MQDDKFLKELLIKGRIETSSDFTLSTMKRLSEVRYVKESNFTIINKRWQRFYLIAFALVAISVIVLSFLVKPSTFLSTPYFKDWYLNEKTSSDILLSIVSFWLLIFINQWMDNNNKRKFMQQADKSY